jgi:GPI mannosyltransferase 3
VVLRPTNLLIWLGVVTIAISRLLLHGKSPLDQRALVILFREAALCGGIVLAISAASDRWFFGEWTFPAYKWIYFNINQSLAVFYGRNPWHYYLSQGMPLLTTTYLPFVVVSLLGLSPMDSGATIQQTNSLHALRASAVSTVAALSVIAHKEVRFIYPLLPVFHIDAASYLASFFTKMDIEWIRGRPQSRTRLTRRPLIALIVLVNVLLAGYLSLFHQAGPLSVTNFIRYEYERLHPDQLGVTGQTPFLPPHNISAPPKTDNELFALFLMPCHSTPWRSRLVHSSLRARALTCEPPLHTAPDTAERRDYLDEADRFYQRDAQGQYGVSFLEREIWPLEKKGALKTEAEEIPRYIVGFEGIQPVLESYLTGPGRATGMKITRKTEIGNGLFNEDWRRQGKIVVWDTGIYPTETPEWVDKLFHEEL